MGWRNEQCRKVCRIIDNFLANRPTERDSLIVAVQKAFDALEANEGQRWIPVTEMFPENDDKVLITHSHGIGMAWWNGRYWTGSMIKKYKTVTAWMPLPEPWKGEEDEAD